MQARYGDEMGNAGLAEQFPVGAGYGVLVADDKRDDDAGIGIFLQCAGDPLTDMKA